MYDSCGNLLKKVHFPSGSGYTCDCAFVKNNLYVADYGHKRLYKYAADGLFVGVIAKENTIPVLRHAMTIFM